MNVVIYDGTVFWKAFSTRIWIIFWMSCHFKLKKKNLPSWYRNCCTSSCWKENNQKPWGNFGITAVFGDKTWSSSWMFRPPGEDQDAFQEPDYDFLCSFYRWILIWNSTIGITLWRRLFPMSWDTVVRFEGGFCHLKIYYFALISFYNNRNILIWKLGINVKIQDILIFLCYKKRIWELFCLDRELERHFHSVFS